MSSEILIILDLVLILIVVLLIMIAIREGHSGHEINALMGNKKKRDPEWLREPEGSAPPPPSYDYALRFGESSSYFG